jgi:hypothetical protein
MLGCVEEKLRRVYQHYLPLCACLAGGDAFAWLRLFGCVGYMIPSIQGDAFALLRPSGVWAATIPSIQEEAVAWSGFVGRGLHAINHSGRGCCLHWLHWCGVGIAACMPYQQTACFGPVVGALGRGLACLHGLKRCSLLGAA